MNAYDILECNANSSQEEIKASYHRLLLIYHPDKSNKSIANNLDIFLKIQSAYKLLSKPDERASYDSLLQQISLKEKASELEANYDTENSYLQLEKDFDYDSENGVYLRRCRCGDYFRLNKIDINKILSDNSDDALVETLIIALECNTCSIVLNVLII